MDEQQQPQSPDDCTPAQFGRLMDQLRFGSEDAANELLNLYGKHVYRAVRRRLNNEMRQLFDSDDFSQAVWASFFSNLGTIQRFRQPQSLVAFLARVASNKVIDECRKRLMSQKYNVNRQRSLDASDANGWHDIVSGGPSPSEIAIAREEWRQLVGSLPARYKRVLRLRADGATYQEIARDIGLSERTIRRMIRRVSHQQTEP